MTDGRLDWTPVELREASVPEAVISAPQTASSHYNHEPKRQSDADIDDDDAQTITSPISVEFSPEKLAAMETRPFHRYIFSYPRPLQYTFGSKVLKAGEEDARGSFSKDSLTSDSQRPRMVPRSSSDTPRPLHLELEKQRERLDLFIDLIWVGIVGNVAEVYSSEAFKPEGSSLGSAVLLFVMVFLPTWRIWNGIREYMNNYFSDSIQQRVFIFWLLVLSVFYGNNLAYLTEDVITVRTYCITIYLIIRASLLLIEILYSIFIPWLRRVVLFSALLYLPGIALWIAAIYVTEDQSIGLIFAAIVWDYFIPIVIDTGAFRKMISFEYDKAIDPHHFVNRLSSFFIIILGEGVLLLIRDGPLGIGIHGTAGFAVFGLCIYFSLAYIYFNKDMSHKYIPAVRHRGWRVILWIFCHIPVFMFTLSLSAAIMFIVRHTEEQVDDATTSDTVPGEEVAVYINRAIWIMGVSLGSIMYCLTSLALLDEPLDEPETLRVNNRYLRLLGRGFYILIVVLVPLKEDIDPLLYFGICALGLVWVGTWEWFASMKMGGKLLEPRDSPGLALFHQTMSKHRSR